MNIREGIKEILELQGIPCPLSEGTTNLIMSRLRYEGLVQKCEGERPENPWVVGTFKDGQNSMREAGYTLTKEID